ncbi:MAG: hypothetical protein ABI947_20400 [Chloroflexota bacterium]
MNTYSKFYLAYSKSANLSSAFQGFPKANAANVRKKLKQEIMVKISLKAFALKADLGWILLEQAKADMRQGGEVVSTVTSTQTRYWLQTFSMTGS